MNVSYLEPKLPCSWPCRPCCRPIWPVSIAAFRSLGGSSRSFRPFRNCSCRPPRRSLEKRPRAGAADLLLSVNKNRFYRENDLTDIVDTTDRRMRGNLFEKDLCANHRLPKPDRPSGRSLKIIFRGGGIFFVNKGALEFPFKTRWSTFSCIVGVKESIDF